MPMPMPIFIAIYQVAPYQKDFVSYLNCSHLDTWVKHHCMFCEVNYQQIYVKHRLMGAFRTEAFRVPKLMCISCFICA